MSKSKFSLLLLFIGILMFTSCLKNDEVFKGPSDGPVIGPSPTMVNYLVDVYAFGHHYDYPFQGCSTSFPFEFQIDNNILAIVAGEHLPIIENTVEYWKFKLEEPGNYPGHYTYTLTMYKCDNRIFYTKSDNYTPEYHLYISTPKDTTLCPLMSPVYCNSGPMNKICLSCKERNIAADWECNGYSVDLDTTNLEIDISFTTPNYLQQIEFNFTIPTDASHQILPGNYWIGTVPPGDHPILDCFFVDPEGGSTADFNSFNSGHLTIDTIGTDHVFSWTLYGCNESIWTGYGK